MIITKKALPRRTFLRGMGAAVALPLLDAMVPALTAQSAAAANSVRRLGFVYMPMGAHMPEWTPKSEGTLGDLSPSAPFACAGCRSDHGRHKSRVEERVSRHSRDFKCRIPQRGQGKVDRKHRLLPRHHG